MKRRDLLKKLEKFGIVLIRHGGNHGRRNFKIALAGYLHDMTNSRLSTPGQHLKRDPIGWEPGNNVSGENIDKIVNLSLQNYEKIVNYSNEY